MYKFLKGGIIFISVRLGIHNLEIGYIQTIPQIFKIPFNLGFIGGKINKALYFIGECEGKLIYLDPHFSQQSIPNINDLSINYNFMTYFPTYLYKIDVKNISPAFTMGFYFRSFEEYIKLTEAFEQHNSFSHSIFKFSKIEQNIYKKMSEKKIKFEEKQIHEDYGDYFIVDYVEEDN